jgi:hypothetical protein
MVRSLDSIHVRPPWQGRRTRAPRAPGGMGWDPLPVSSQAGSSRQGQGGAFLCVSMSKCLQIPLTYDIISASLHVFSAQASSRKPINIFAMLPLSAGRRCSTGFVCSSYKL